MDRSVLEALPQLFWGSPHDVDLAAVTVGPVLDHARANRGSRFFAFLVHPVPDDFDIAIDNPLDYADEYLQCAGSSSLMTVELRRREDDSFRH